MKKIILMTFVSLFLGYGISSFTTQDSSLKSELNPAQRFDYEAEFGAFVTAIEKKDKETLEMMNKSETDNDMLLMYFEDPEFMKQLKNADYSKMPVTDYNNLVVLEFSASVSGSDDEGNEYESGISLYFEEAGNGLKLVGVVAAG